MRSLLVCMPVNTCMHMCVYTYAYIYIHVCSASDLFEDVVGILMWMICVYMCVCVYRVAKIRRMPYL